MYTPMYLQTVCFTEWTLPSMYTLMYLQNVCFTECFINTSHQYGRSPVCTPLCTFRLYALLNVLLTHHSNMDAPQYVHSYVPSDYALMNVLLTHHRNMDAIQYVHIDVPSYYVFLNVSLSSPHNMYIPQYVF